MMRQTVRQWPCQRVGNRITIGIGGLWQVHRVNLGAYRAGYIRKSLVPKRRWAVDGNAEGECVRCILFIRCGVGILCLCLSDGGGAGECRWVCGAIKQQPHRQVWCERVGETITAIAIRVRGFWQVYRADSRIDWSVYIGNARIVRERWGVVCIYAATGKGSKAGIGRCFCRVSGQVRYKIATVDRSIIGYFWQCHSGLSRGSIGIAPLHGVSEGEALLFSIGGCMRHWPGFYIAKFQRQGGTRIGIAGYIHRLGIRDFHFNGLPDSIGMGGNLNKCNRCHCRFFGIYRNIETINPMGQICSWVLETGGWIIETSAAQKF